MKKELKTIDFIVPTDIKKFCVEQLKADLAFKELKVKKVSTDKKSKLSTIILESEKELNLESVNLGAKLNELKVKASAEFQIQKVEKKVEEGIEPLKLKFERAIARDFEKLYKEELNIQKIVSINEGKSIDVYFDVSHIKGRSKLVAHIAKIFDCVNVVRYNKKDAQDSKDIQKAIATLEANCNYIEKTHERHLKIKGSELVKRGYASPYLSENQKKLPLWTQLFKILKGAQQRANLQYYYMGRLVEQEKEYIVRLKKPIKLKEPELINHAREILNHYEYGEQLSKGQGIKEVENYYKTIVKIHNENLEQAE